MANATQPALITLASTIKAKHLEYQALVTKTDALWLEISAHLKHAKTLVPHGYWIVWLKDECGLSRQQGHRYLTISNVSHREGHLDNHRETMKKARATRKAHAKGVAEEFVRDAGCRDSKGIGT